MRRIVLADEETVEIIYGDHRILVGVTNLEPSEQVPELEVILPKELAVNCWADHMIPAEQLDDTLPHVRVASQICVPLD